MSAPDLVLLGNLLVDDIVLRDGSTLMGEPGGAMLYASLAARLWGARVGLVSVRGTDYPAAALDLLAARGMDLSGIRALGRPGVRTWLLYEPRVRRVIHHLGCPSHEEVSPQPGDIPASFAGARAFHLAPMPLARQLELATGLPAGAGAPFVSLDPHVPLDEETAGDYRGVLAHVDALFAGEDELRLSDPDPLRLAQRLATRPLAFVAFKHGARGGTLAMPRRGEITHWAAHAGRVVDTTGAGDAFAGGFLAGWLEHEDVTRALEQGVVSASFAIEDWGPRAMLRATRDDAGRRRREWFGS